MKWNDINTEENRPKRNKVIAWITTLVLHGLLLICFVFMGLTHQIPPPPEYGIEVDMGGGGGGSKAQTANPIPAEPAPASPQRDHLSTQDVEESTPINATRQTPTHPTRTQTQPTPTETTPVNEAPAVNPNALFRRNAAQGGGGSGTGNGSGTGSGSGTGIGSNSGNGAGNYGGDFFLDGRPVINKAFPTAKNNIEGVVKVDFRADRDGAVVYAKAGGRGTTINDSQIWEECEKAAKRSKFKAKSDAQVEEKGVITYRFILQ
jgi:hypothetical protein